MVRPKQGKLPGTQTAEVKEIEEAMEEVKEYEQERMAFGRKEEAARDRLLKIMKKHKRKNYVASSLVVEIISAKEKVSVRKRKEEKKGK